MDTTTIQAQEEADFVPTSELEMCLEEARLYRPKDVTPMGEGDFTLQVSSAYHCKSTDAVAGSYVSQAWRFETREAAEEAKRQKYEYGDPSEEEEFVILDKEGVDVSEGDADALAAMHAEEFELSEPPF